MRRKVIGQKEFPSHVDITDPCYKRDVWCRMNGVPIREGLYTCIAWYHTEKNTENEPSCQNRCVGILGIYLNGIIPSQGSMKKIDEIGVDAGLAGFFRYKPDYSDEEWTNFCTMISKGSVWLTDEGFYSHSGFGDGCYGVYAQKVNQEIVALEIRFI